MDKESRAQIMTLTFEVRLPDKTLFSIGHWVTLVRGTSSEIITNVVFISEDTILWVQIFCPTISSNLLDSQKFLDSVYPLFLKYLVLSETLFLIEILRGEDPTTGEDLFLGEDSFFREVSSRAVRAPGNRLPLRRKLRGIRASGIFCVRSVPQSEV